MLSIFSAIAINYKFISFTWIHFTEFDSRKSYGTITEIQQIVYLNTPRVDVHSKDRDTSLYEACI